VSRVFVISFDHTQAHTTVGRTPLEEGSARRRDLYLTTQTLYKRQTSMPPGGIRTHDPSKCSAADRTATGILSISKIHSVAIKCDDFQSIVLMNWAEYKKQRN
jgi:hypothetical protein